MNSNILVPFFDAAGVLISIGLLVVLIYSSRLQALKAYYYLEITAVILFGLGFLVEGVGGYIGFSPLLVQILHHSFLTTSGTILIISGLVLPKEAVEREGTEKALENKEYFLSKSQQVAHIGSYDLDVLSGKWTSSATLDEIFGIEADYQKDLEGWLKLVHPEHKDEMSHYFAQYVLVQRHAFNKEYRIVRKKDGAERWVHGLGELEFDKDGKPVRMIGTIQDITERKKVIEALEKNERSLKEAQRVAHVGNWELDLVSNVLTWSEEIYRIFEITPSEFGLSYKSFLDMVHPDDREKVDKAYTESVKNHTQYDIEHRLLFKGGRIKYVHERCETIYDTALKPIRSVGTVQDITARKEAEILLKQAEERFRALIEHSTEVSIVLNRSGKLTYVSSNIINLTGRTQKEVLDIPSFDINIHPDDKQVAQKIFGEILKTPGAEKKTRIRISHKDGRWRWFDCVVQNRLNIPAIEGIVVSMREATYEQELDQAKTNFVSLASHQLRTPLSAVRWYTELLLENKTLPTESRQYIEVIAQSNLRMIRLVNELLNISRSESGILALHPQELNLPEFIHHIVKEFALAYKEKNIHVIENYDPKITRTQLDFDVMNLIVSNVISNAFLYSNNGGTVEISLVLKGDRFVLAVKDNGIGIPMEAQKNMFGKLFRADNARNQATDASGLGLYLVKVMLERIGGTIRFESAQDRGTTFFIEFPLANMKKQEGSWRIAR